MKPESIVSAVAGAFFGLIVGWVIGSQQAGAAPSGRAASRCQPAPCRPRPRPPARRPGAAPARRSAGPGAAGGRREEPLGSAVRVDLGNLYFDAERYPEAVTWYQEALKLDPEGRRREHRPRRRYYYMNQPDRALQQFD